jgi:hypothetical protein
MIADWVEMVSRHNRSLGALLRGILMIEKQDGRLRFIWCSEFHKKTGAEREADIREYLGALRELPITHRSLSDLAQEDPMIQEALNLGAKIKFIEDVNRSYAPILTRRVTWYWTLAKID